MASTDITVFEQLSSQCLTRIEKNPDLRATLTAVAERIHSQPGEVSAMALHDLGKWLVQEGYDTESLGEFVTSLIQSEAIDASQDSITLEESVGSLISILDNSKLDLLDVIVKSVDHSTKIHEALFGLAGGTSRPSVAKSLNLKSIRKLTTREAAAESGLSRKASADSGNASVVGRDGADEQKKEYSRTYGAVRGNLQRSKDSRAEFRRTEPGSMGATEKVVFTIN